MKQTLEKILSKVKELGKKAVVVGTIIGILSTASVKASGNPGYMEVKNCLNSNTKTITINRDNINHPEATDGYDNGLDGRANSMPNGFPDIYSVIPGYNLWDDFRNEDSNIPYDIPLLFNGTPSDPNNKLEFDFPYGEDWDYGNKPILFQSDRLPYGPVVDVRRAINQNNKIVPLIPLSTNPYPSPYGSGELDIGSRILADLNDDGKVDFKDYSILANDFGKLQGQYVGDINGVFGIPDGFVDNRDLSAFCDDYLKDVNDL